MKPLFSYTTAVLLSTVSALPAWAEGEALPAGAAWQPLIMLGIFVVIFYLMIWRPQSKRSKEHKQLMASLKKGDEVVTTGGIVGKIARVSDEFVALEIGTNVEIKLQRSAISATLIKGTLKSI